MRACVLEEWAYALFWLLAAVEMVPDEWTTGLGGWVPRRQFADGGRHGKAVSFRRGAATSAACNAPAPSVAPRRDRAR